MKHYVNKAVDLDGLVYVEDVDISLEVTTEIDHLEPYPWGQSRGTEVVISDVNLLHVQVGGLTLTPKQAEQMFGEDALQRAVDSISLDDLSE